MRFVTGVQAKILLILFFKQEHRDTDSSRTPFGGKVLGAHAVRDRSTGQDSPNHALLQGGRWGIEINKILYVSIMCVRVCVCAFVCVCLCV
jgi:hypothetical protein